MNRSKAEGMLIGDEYWSITTEMDIQLAADYLKLVKIFKYLDSSVLVDVQYIKDNN